MKYFRPYFAKWISNSAIMSFLFAVMPVSAADPDYIFSMTEDHEPELCAHMKTVFNTYFQHMWRDPVLTSTLDALYSSNSEYAFPLLPGTLHDTRMTMAMSRSKIPSSPEFDAIQWHEGHSVFGGAVGGPSDFNNSYLLPYLIAYVDIDNDGIVDTVVKDGFSRGYAWIFAKGEADPQSSETLVTYRDTKLNQFAPTTLAELIFGSEKSGKPIWIGADYLRPFIYGGKTYVANYSQGSYEAPTKLSRANLKSDIPPHEQMFVSFYTYKGAIDTIGRPKWTQKTLCAFDMRQDTVNH